MSSYIYSKEYSFEEIIQISGISKYNKNGESINKDIYFTYNVFAYSSPEEFISKINIQRFKEVKEKGKYVYNNKRGEFFILGTNYEGEYIYNVYFPVDIVPESLPSNWNFLYYKEFEDSWNVNFKYKEQLDYMKETELMFDEIDLENNSCDSYNFKEYGIIAIKLGLGKFRLNTPATWKTMGIVTAKRRINNTIRDVIFATRPMAIDANIVSKVSCEDEVYINEDEDEKHFNIDFGADVVNLTKYANKNHIKKINSEIYINGKFVDSISGSKTTEVDKKVDFVVSREKENFSRDESTLSIEVISYLYTEFLNDGLIYDSYIKQVKVKIAPKKLVPVSYLELNMLSFSNNSLVVSPLVQTINTNNAKSLGIIEKERSIAVICTLGIDRKYIDEISLFINNKKQKFDFSRDDNKVLIIRIAKIEDVNITIGTWNTLRDIKGSIFEVADLDIGKRIKEPNELKVALTLNVNQESYEYITYFDVVDKFTNNINYNYIDNILNYEDIKIKNEI